MWLSSILKSESLTHIIAALLFLWENLKLFYASERSTFSFTGIVASGDESGRPSALDGWDSCFAAAWRTRFWTSEDDGDVGSPMRFVSSFPAAHVNAWAPSLTGASNSLQAP